MTEPEITPIEEASDAELRAWAKENGIEDVPASGRLSAAWRETITTAMAAALDPKEEASVEPSSPDPVVEETPAVEETTPEVGSTEGYPVEYRSVFQAPNTFVTGQTYTA